MATIKKPKYPKAVGACIDLLYNMRDERLELGRQVDAMKKAEAALEDHILNTFTKDQLKGAKGDIATASVSITTNVSVVDWDAFLKFVVKTKAYELLRRQPASTAVKERWDNNMKVDGLEPFPKVGLSLTKAGK